VDIGGSPPQAWAPRLGDEGQGVATIIEMVAATRLDCVLGSAALVRYGPPEVADAWCASRLGGDWAGAFGTLSRDVPSKKIVSRGFPGS
jgi:hypothetical protein